MVQGLGHKGQGQKGRRSRSTVVGQGNKVVGQGQMSQRSRSMVVGQGHKVKGKVVWGVFSPHRLAGGSTGGHFHSYYYKITIY